MTFEEIIEKNEGLIWKVVNKYGIDYLDKEDLYQECLTKIWEEKDKYNDEYELTTYLWVICSNHLSNIVKYENNQKRKNHVENSKGLDIILNDIKNYDLTDYLNEYKYSDYERDVLITAENVLNELEDIQYKIIYKYLFEGLTQREIGREFGFSKSYVSILWLDYIEKIKEEL